MVFRVVRLFILPQPSPCLIVSYKQKTAQGIKTQMASAKMHVANGYAEP